MAMDQFKEWVKQFDVDKDGRISRDELREAIRSTRAWFPRWKANRGVKAADANIDGFVDDSTLKHHGRSTTDEAPRTKYQGQSTTDATTGATPFLPDSDLSLFHKNLRVLTNYPCEVFDKTAHPYWMTQMEIDFLIDGVSLGRISLSVAFGEHQYVDTLPSGNLDEKVSDRVLYDILIQAGRVVDLYIPRDKETNRPKGFPFAEYETEEIADYAVELFSGL
ncbi:hypothetical protein RHGRI_021878 [Rhododendron griersonianum]|uniref:EF-hand domain-containing protein n=1 Tax=Rhododendron griersonianum TaxID=479676 RepID=A0AAV6JQQ2_9ERIC|nr:hypothetical protein RHGRI_021878 [Rhododendron griersonianum]